MQLTMEEALQEISSALEDLPLGDIIKLWNKLFPQEEHIDKNVFFKKSPEETEDLKKEFCGMIVDEISCDGTEEVSKIYRLIFKESLFIVGDNEDDFEEMSGFDM